MTNIFYVIMLALLMPCISIAREQIAPQSFIARVTFYNGREDGFGKKTCQRGVYARHGRTVATDLTLLELGMKLRIKALKGIVGKTGEFMVEDTGTAVIKKVASKRMAKWMLRKDKISKQEYEKLRNAPVIDVFVDVSHKAMERLANSVPYYMTVEIVQS